MKFNFKNIDKDLLCGINEVKDELGIELAPDGIAVEVGRAEEGISITKNGDSVSVAYGKKNEFFRALSQIKYVYLYILNYELIYCY